jgi:molecular chaperone DnaK
VVKMARKALGIDLGTTNSVVAIMEGDRPTVIPNAEGSRLTPSVVAFTKDGQRLVGQLAKRQAILNPENTIFSIKRFMGRRYDEVQEEIKRVPYKVVPGPNNAVRVEIMGKLYAPEEISAMILKKLVDDAERYLGERVTDVVITVPAYFNDAQRQATKTAGEIAGLNVLRIINEPTAASLAYGLDKKTNATILVFDLGGGTFDVSILEVGEGVFEVRATSGDTHLGGDDFDKRLVDWVADEFMKEHGIDLRKDSQALQRLYEACEKAKCELSTLLETRISLPFITADATGPKHLDITITRARFESLCQDLFERLKGPLFQALEDAKLRPKDIDEVVLVGGATRMPAVQRLVREVFGKEPCQGVNPDEVVAVGAAIQAAVLVGGFKDILLLDVVPISLGVEVKGGLFHKIIERNTTIPVRRTEIFTTAEDFQTSVEIHVLQGERPMARDNRSLGRFYLEGIPPAPRGVPQIEVTFDIDANGILHVTARDKATGKEQRVTITGSTNLPKEEIERMMREAEMYAQEDRKRKELAELKNQADNLAYQVEKQLKDLGDKVPQAEKARAESLIEQIKRLCKEESPDATRLRQLMNDLQQAAYTISEIVYKQATGTYGQTSQSDTSQRKSDDVIDAEYEEKK